MADIELVVKIPEEEYKNICLMSKDGICMALYDWIANGVPLPKGHGRLIDADELLKQSYRIDDSETLSTRDVVNEEEIDNAPTIIEADKEL